MLQTCRSRLHHGIWIDTGRDTARGRYGKEWINKISGRGSTSIGIDHEDDNEMAAPFHSQSGAAETAPPNRLTLSSPASGDTLASVALSTNIAWSRGVDEVFGAHRTQAGT